MWRKYSWLILVAGFACALSSGSSTYAEEQPKAPTGPQYGTWGVDLSGMDTTVKPGDDFYKYVNGAWAAKAEIPPDKPAFGPFSVLGDVAFEQVKTLLEEDAADTHAPKGSDRQKIGDWYASMMDEKKLAADGLEPIRPDLRNLDAWYEAFGIQPGDKLYLPKEERVQPW